MARIRLAAFLSAICIAALVTAPARAAIPAGNLIVNGDAEAGTGSSDSSTTAPTPITGWTATTNFTEHTYDPAGSANFPDVNASAAINGGNQFFAGGPDNGNGNGVETAVHDISVSGAAPEIDAGVVTATLFADLGGFAAQEDQGKVTAVFLGGAAQQLGTLTVGPVTAEDRGNTTEFLPRIAFAAVPRGTQTIRVVMTATKFSGAYNDAYFDNVSLSLWSAAPPPVLGKSIDAVPVSGLVFVKPPPGKSLRALGGEVAGAALAKGTGFVPLTEARQLPAGSQVDARQGSLSLVAASGHAGKTQTGVFGGGLFALKQVRPGRTKGLTTLSLVEGDFPGSPSYATCPKATTDSSDPSAQAALSRRVLQTLHARGHGRFRTRGRYSAATVRGTVWDTIDRCDGTLTVVHRGTVKVTDFKRRKTVTVHAGHSYLAKAITGKRK